MRQTVFGLVEMTEWLAAVGIKAASILMLAAQYK